MRLSSTLARLRVKVSHVEATGAATGPVGRVAVRRRSPLGGRAPPVFFSEPAGELCSAALGFSAVVCGAGLGLGPRLPFCLPRGAAADSVDGNAVAAAVGSGDSLFTLSILLPRSPASRCCFVGARQLLHHGVPVAPGPPSMLG